MRPEIQIRSFIPVTGLDFLGFLKFNLKRLGVRRFEEDDNYAMVAALSVPLPLFNRNQGKLPWGALDYLEVLDAQRSLVEAKKNYVELLKTLQCSVANLARLCSIHFHGSDGEMF